ncbi:MAG: hypothetical protein H6Q73_865 [Firmicutes bacterium]|nr:hypothetical protein [Bacillota bacterium]
MVKPVCEEVERALSAQRHQFINHIQVIHALLELKRVDNALKYMEDLAKDPALLSDPLVERGQSKCRAK